MAAKTTFIFDLDGTLIHSAPDLQAALNAALQEIGRGPLDLSTVITFVGNGVEKLVERGLTATGGSSPDLHRATLEAFLQIYNANGVALTRTYDGVLDQLERLTQAGKKLAICTNKPHAPARHICEELGLSRFFSVIIGATANQPKKPDPSSLQRAIRALGSNRTETVFVGDSAVDYRTAKAAHVDFWLYAGGYLNEELPVEGCARRFADWRAPALFLDPPTSGTELA
ncbi:HAD-IA family hydrolase [uncultured Roseobacter sp.]|uniref:HAD family hydrolase n=1 Tax=uncultured Roseobacter sp. TaxID=114847 RepID=UPI0026219FCA|nr:HAD-IA family hydrolase [uncultured Roseobacter sp.]